MVLVVGLAPLELVDEVVLAGLELGVAVGSAEPPVTGAAAGGALGRGVL